MFTNLSIDPTYDCNESCISCKCSELSQVFRKWNTLSLDKYRLLIDDFIKIGGKSVSIFGGEPLMFQNTFPILQYAKLKGLSTSITTNGTLLSNEDILSKLKECDLDQIVLSVMNVNDSYVKLHGRDNFTLFVNGVNKLLFDPCIHINDISFHMTIQKKNYKNLADVVRLAAELGVRKVTSQYVSIVPLEINKNTERELGEAFHNEMFHWNIDRNVLISSEDIEQCKESICEALEVSKTLDILLYVDPIFYSERMSESLVTGCFHANGYCELKDIIVLPNGMIGACPMLQHYIIGDLNSQSLSEIISSKAFVNLTEKVSRGDFLPICDYCCRHSMFYKEDSVKNGR